MAEQPAIGLTFTSHESVPLQHHTSDTFADCVLWFDLNSPLAEPQ